MTRPRVAARIASCRRRSRGRPAATALSLRTTGFLLTGPRFANLLRYDAYRIRTGPFLHSNRKGTLMAAPQALDPGFNLLDPLVWEQRVPLEELAILRGTAPVWWNTQSDEA